METCATNSSYSKLDVADLLLGAEPVEFTTPLITDVFTRLLEMKCYRAGLGHLTRSQWVAVITALENEKHVVVKVCATKLRWLFCLMKRSKGWLPNSDKERQRVERQCCCESHSGRARIVRRLFRIEERVCSCSVSNHRKECRQIVSDFICTCVGFSCVDVRVVSQHYLCFSGRVLGLGAEKKQLIHMGHVVGIELNKKNLEIVHGNPQQRFFFLPCLFRFVWFFRAQERFS